MNDLDYGTCIICRKRLTSFDSDDQLICQSCIDKGRKRIIYSLDMGYVLEMLEECRDYLDSSAISLLVEDDFNTLENIIEYEIGDALEYFDIPDLIRKAVDTLRKEKDNV